MKTTIFYLAISTILLLSGCEYDNYEEPSSELSGGIVYEGASIGVKSNQVQIELWQDGYELSQDIPVYVAQDGSYSATLLDGEYQLVVRQDNGPWVNNTDSINVQLEGTANVEVPVEPYYILNSESINQNAGSIEASFSVEQINGNRDLEYVALYVGTTNIVDRVYNEASTTEPGDQVTLGDTINLSVDPSNNIFSDREDIFGRIGLKIEGKTDLLYSQIYNIGL